jgi:hypothetical protein
MVLVVHLKLAEVHCNRILLSGKENGFTYRGEHCCLKMCIVVWLQLSSCSLCLPGAELAPVVFC